MPDTPAPARRPWLLLIHQLPKDPAYLRVKIGRRLAAVGAVALKNSVYVLPRTEGAAEDLHWLRREIVEGGGEATVAEVELVDGLTDDEVESRFRAASDAEYAELGREARELGVSVKPRRARPLAADERASLLAGVVRLERRLEEIGRTDFFGASLRETAAGLLSELRARALPPSPEPEPEHAAPPRGRTWVTRTGIHVDRIASAWLIRRAIDPEAAFKFVPPKGYAPLPGELRFDMFEAEYSHAGDHCTFETLIERFGLREPGLRGVAELVHDIDLKESKFGRPETPGVAACLAGLCRVVRDDDERLRRGSDLFESLLSHYATQKDERATRA